jgi:uracil-DNA glycosylase
MMSFGPDTTRFADYAAFNQAKCLCRDCPVGPVYDCVVPSVGQVSKPKALFVGEAPGADEIAKGEPFIGRSGQLLRRTINLLGFHRDNALITNTIPCRPENNRFPSDESAVHFCVERWLREELRLTDPACVVLVGSQALWHVLGLRGISRLRGQWQTLPIGHRTVDCLPTYHPAYVLRRSDDPSVLLDFQEDMRQVARRVLAKKL